MITSNQQPPRSKCVVAIVGGGFTGAAVAYHLATGDKAGAADIVVFEPRTEIGKGLAYDTSDPVHRINVPAARMSIRPDDLEHFARWIDQTGAVTNDPAAYREDGSVFPRRSVFGDYVLANLKPLLDKGAVKHVRAAVVRAEKQDERWHVTDGNGETLIADILVIAATHPTPVPPARLVAALAGHPRFIADPTARASLAPIRPHDRVLVVGNGLTSADVIASLKRGGHEGRITALSRRGLRSRSHAPFVQEPYGDFLLPPSASASELLVRIRTAIRAAAEDGLSWHPVIDQVRAQGSAIWADLPVVERRRIVSHLRPYWDVHRFRIAPQVAGVLDAEIAAGRLDVLAAAIVHAGTDGKTIEIDIRRRGREKVERQIFDAVVVTTGPAHGNVLASQEWLRRLGDLGHLHVDPTGLGLACDRNANAIRPDGVADQSLLIAGPLARGHVGELMGFPQVAEHALLVAGSIAARL
ncbi:Uncharacterized NAD(P)/FAD-binding protein YdhS [Rhizobium sp. NFR07]|uniref:FAD/NAD(P)-binding protein n=1 Tax=Rhizobium sp. NFR07 TaxID=1566262 RepID=UPI0008E780FD|nr:FAD/NAD(P)-binding protein [Rhizobium sp. NFR07]SFA80190.1 Uncharacterized NAD(P)/FAD-binding protein YdhS [Rhizobium sp. NFR07]